MPWALSQILPIISYILSNLGFYKNTHHIATKIVPQNYAATKLLYLHKKSPTKTPLKPVTIRHSKAHYYTTLLKSPLLRGNIFTKSYKVQILIWHLFYKVQIIIWHYFHKAQMIIWHYFHKAQILFWQSFLKAQYYFDNYF